MNPIRPILPSFALVLVLVLALVIVAGPAAAGTAGWTDAATVTLLEAGEHDRFVVRLGVGKNASGCRDPDRFYADYGRNGSELMYHTLLQAALAQQRVQLYVTGVCDLRGYSGISAVRLVP